jgi:hypothetical protein
MEEKWQEGRKEDGGINEGRKEIRKEGKKKEIEGRKEGRS